MLIKKKVLITVNDANRIRDVIVFLSEYYNIIGCLLINETISNELYIESCPIVTRLSLNQYQYDSVLVVAGDLDLEKLSARIESLGVPKNKIDWSFINSIEISRDKFLDIYSKECRNNNTQGCCAECGVYKGEFAKRINKFFCDRSLFLFDYFDSITVNELLKKMPYPEKCRVFKGDFLYTSKSIDNNDVFCYVHLDFNEYYSTRYALEVFKSKMVNKGIIAIHDYYNRRGEVKMAVDEFLRNNNSLYSVPMAGGSSIAIVGFDKRG